MTKKLLQQLVLASYSGKKLDAKKVDAISARLDRQALKAYIRALKLMEQQRKVYIAMPKANVYNTSKKTLEHIFPEKELIFQEDPSLLLGMQLVDNDMVYDMSLKKRLENILDEVDNQYNQ